MPEVVPSHVPTTTYAVASPNRRLAPNAPLAGAVVDGTSNVVVGLVVVSRAVVAGGGAAVPVTVVVEIAVVGAAPVVVPHAVASPTRTRVQPSRHRTRRTYHPEQILGYRFRPCRSPGMSAASAASIPL